MRALAIVASMGIAAVAQAQPSTFRDPTTGLELSLAVPGATTCVVRPRALRADPSSCEGLDLEAMSAKLGPTVHLAQVVRFPDWSFVLTISGEAIHEEAPMSREEGRALVSSIVGARAAGGVYRAESAEPEFLVSRGLQVLRFALLPSTDQPRAGATLMYLLVGKGSMAMVSFIGTSAELSRIKQAATGIIAGVAMPAGRDAVAWPESRAEAVRPAFTSAISGLVGSVLSLAVMCGAGVFAYRRIRRDRAAKQPPPSLGPKA